MAGCIDGCKLVIVRKEDSSHTFTGKDHISSILSLASSNIYNSFQDFADCFEITLSAGPNGTKIVCRL